MHFPKPALTLLAALLTSMAGCASSPALCPAVPPPVELPPLPAQVMDSPIPDFEQRLQLILSSSMGRLSLSSPTSPSAPAPSAKH